MKKRIILLFGLVALFLFGLFFVPAEGGKVKNVNLKATFRDLMGDKLRSDGLGTYTHGVDGVTCYITPNGELYFILDSPNRRHAVAELAEDQRARNPFYPEDPTTYPTDYYSGPTGILSFCTHWFYPRYPINLLEMAPNSTAWGATFIRYWPERYNQGVQVLRFYDPELDPLSLRDPSYHSCVLLVSAHDANGDGQNESWDFEPIPTLGESTNVAWVWRLDKIYTYFGWFYVPFKLTVQRLT